MENDEGNVQNAISKMSRPKIFDSKKIDCLRKELLNLPPKGVPLTKILRELKIACSNGYSLKELSMICKEKGIIVSPEYLQKIFSMDIDDESLPNSVGKTECESRRGVIKTNFGDI